jgi:hypothetical protein
MTTRKTKLIQERNIFLEKKYIQEQAPPPPPPPPGGNVPPPPPPGGNVPPPQVVTTTTTNKMTKDFYKNLSLCSSVKSPENPEEIKTEFGIVLKDPKGKQPYCKKEDN